MIKALKGDRSITNLFSQADAQMARLEPVFPKPHGKPRVDDRRVLCSIIFQNFNGLRWHHVPMEYGPPKTRYNPWNRWSGEGVFGQMMEGLAAEATVSKRVMIDATSLKGHRKAISQRSTKGRSATSGAF